MDFRHFSYIAHVCRCRPEIHVCLGQVHLIHPHYRHLGVLRRAIVFFRLLQSLLGPLPKGVENHGQAIVCRSLGTISLHSTCRALIRDTHLHCKPHNCLLDDLPVLVRRLLKYVRVPARGAVMSCEEGERRAPKAASKLLAQPRIQC